MKDNTTEDVHVPGQIELPVTDSLYWPEGEAAEPEQHSEDRAVVLAPHEPILAGTFALYATPEGGFVLATETVTRGVEHHVFPAAVVKLGMQMAGGGGGPLGSMLRRVMGG